MKLGIVFNVFDGEENLPAAVESVRHVADFLGVTYQETSNFGERRDVEPLLKLFKDLKFDAVVKYEPGLSRGSASETTKRNLGLQLSEVKGCTHFMTMDCDEIYDTAEIAFVKQDVIENDYDSTACQMLTYYKKPNIVLDPPEDYFVPLIYKIDKRRFGQPARFPVLVDPTRRLDGKRARVYQRSEIQMHHYSYIRNDIRQKLRNSSAVVNFHERLEEIAQYYENYQDGQPAYFAGSEKRLLPVKVL